MFVAKTSDATSWHELMQERSARFPQSFVRQPNDPECTQIVRNAPKCQFRVQWGGLGAFVVTEFCKATKRSECTQIVRCEKFLRDFEARTFALVRSVLQRLS